MFAKIMILTLSLIKSRLYDHYNAGRPMKYSRMKAKENNMIMITHTMERTVKKGMGMLRTSLMDSVPEIEAISKGRLRDKMMKILLCHMMSILRKTEHMPSLREGLMPMLILPSLWKSLF